jgi:putative phage-type endonuclease
MNRMEWLRARQQGLGSSDIGPVLGLDPWRGPLDIYHEKTRPIDEADEAGNVHILRGRLLEPVLAELFVEMTGRPVLTVEEAQVHPDYHWARSNPDREIPMEKPGPLELKAPTVRTYETILGAGLFPTQIAQIQWEMFVGQYEWGCFAFGNLEKEPPIVWFDVEPDDEWIARALPRLEEFWQLVEARTPPESQTLPETPKPIYKGEAEALGSVAEAVEVLAKATDHLEQTKALLADSKESIEDWLTRANLDTVFVTGLGKAKLIGSKSGPTKDWDALVGHRPIDRDALYMFLLDYGAGSDVEEWLTELELDLGRFVTPGSPYTYIRFYREKEE